MVHGPRGAARQTGLAACDTPWCVALLGNSLRGSAARPMYCCHYPGSNFRQPVDRYCV